MFVIPPIRLTLFAVVGIVAVGGLACYGAYKGIQAGFNALKGKESAS
jgi:hypothetical protein